MHTTPLPPPPAPPEPPRVLTLQETCWKVIRRHTNTSNVLELLQFFEKYATPQYAAPTIQKRFLDFVCASYELLRERRGTDALKRLLPSQVHHSLELSSKQRQKIATYYRQLLRGRVLERWPCPHDARLHAPSVAGLPYCYRYTALTHYMQWPEDVHPSCREIYLCNAEFEALFGMTYCEFSAKPAWRRLQLKQQLHLF